MGPESLELQLHALLFVFLVYCTTQMDFIHSFFFSQECSFFKVKDTAGEVTGTNKFKGLYVKNPSGHSKLTEKIQ